MTNVLRITHWASLILPAIFVLLPGSIALPLALACSFLHFSASLMIFYSQPELRRQHTFIGLILPPLLILLLAGWGLLDAGSYARWLVIFFAFVFWHYAKQSYGFFVLSFRGEAAFDNPKSTPRQITLAYFLWLAIFGFFSSQTQQSSLLVFGIYVPSLGLAPAPVLWIGRSGALAGLAYCAWICFRHKKWEPLLTALSFFLWADLQLTAFRLLLLLPALHALQYLPIVFLRVRARPGLPWVRWLAAWLALGAAMILLFHVKPHFALWSLGLVGAIELTMNLQHYLIDAYIWRFREPAIRAEMGR